jgi:hypothetical protein
MEKKQVQTFWKALHQSTSNAEVIRRYDNRTGYDSDRNLERYVQVDQGFRRGLSLAELSKKTGWSVGRLEELKPWWEEAFPELKGASAGQSEEEQEGKNYSNQSRSEPTREGAAGQSKADDPGGHAPQNGLRLPPITDYQIAHFFGLKEVKRIRGLLERLSQSDEHRLYKFIARLEGAWGLDRSMPEPWLVAVAGLPMVAERIGIPAFTDIVGDILRERPHKGRNERRAYHKAVRVHLREAWEQTSAWAVPCGYEFIPMTSVEIMKLDSWEKLANHEISAEEDERTNNRIEEALMKGCLRKTYAYGVKVPLENIGAGLIWDMFTRLPDVDRRKGRVFRRTSMKQLFVRWRMFRTPPIIKEATRVS